MISTIRPSIRALQQINDEKVLAETSKTWSEWVQAINLWSGNKTELWSIAEHLIAKHKLSHLWAATIASYYQIERRRNTAHAN